MASKDVLIADKQVTTQTQLKKDPNAAELRQEMTATRQSISNHVDRMEELMSQRIRDTADHVSVQVVQTADKLSQRIKETTDYVSQGIRTPISELKTKLEVPAQKIRQDPLRSLAVAAASGLLTGMMLARRAKSRARMLRRELQASLPPEIWQAQPTPAAHKSSAAWTGLMFSLGSQVAQQLLHLGIARLAESLPPPGRSSTSRQAETDYAGKRQGASSSPLRM